MSVTANLIHLRRMSARRGIAVVACTHQPIRTGTRLRFANFIAGATCTRCIEVMEGETERTNRRQMEVVR